MTGAAANGAPLKADRERWTGRGYWLRDKFFPGKWWEIAGNGGLGSIKAVIRVSCFVKTQKALLLVRMVPRTVARGAPCRPCRTIAAPCRATTRREAATGRRFFVMRLLRSHGDPNGCQRPRFVSLDSFLVTRENPNGHVAGADGARTAARGAPCRPCRAIAAPCRATTRRKATTGRLLCPHPTWPRRARMGFSFPTTVSSLST